ncbi:hypothetical protein F511_03773 [Dorcoceras hygrometricum]|uniref:Splicing factor 3B subunit 1-like n=1 Tax=Dorcoceras hygrometricum TaxID=472368 RepID=A0A2Z7B6A7_9LAMI|nr:hypothetical protein F511_03773 [Dorcoceras hygrometricum]
MASSLISNSLHISFDSVLDMDDAGLVAVFESFVATGWWRGSDEKVGGEEVADAPRVKKTPVKKAASKKRPATAAAAEPVVKKKRNTMSKSVSAKGTLEILPVAQEVVPLQMIAPTSVASAKQPHVPKRKTQKRKRRLILGPHDEIVDSEPVVGGSIVVEAAVEVVDDTAEKEVETVVESVDKPVSLPVVADVLNEGISTGDDVDIIIEQVIAETAQLETDEGEHVDGSDVSRATAEDQAVGKADEVERWFNLPYEVLFARDTEQMVTISLPVVADVLNEGISTGDDVDIIIEQVIAETAQLETDEGEHVDGSDVSRATAEDQAVGKADEVERWFNLPYEVLFARDTEQMVTTANDTDEEFIIDQVFGTGVEKMETEAVEQSADEAMSLEDILMTIPSECPLPSAYVDIMKIILGKTISIPGFNEGDWYKASLPKISAADKGKAPLLERDPIKGNPIKEQFSVILADIEVLVMLREKIIDDVDRFFNYFSLKRLATLKIDESYFDKEALILSWAETDSTRVALNRRTYILTKYRELLIRKFLEARKINFIPDEGSSATDFKVMGMLSDLHLFVVEDLKEQTMAHEAVMPKMGKVVAAAPNLLLTIKADPAGEMMEVEIELMYREVVLGKVVAEVEVRKEAIGVDLPREDIPAVVVDRSEDNLKIG